MTRLVAVFVLVAAVALSSGCGRVKKEIVSLWPKAEAERRVERPADETRWPLTGLDASSAEDLQRRTMSVKIENSAASRPQTNLQAADVVYETITEGGITRFNAIYHSQRPDVIGPVRSARLSDASIVPQYKALFFFSGASTYVNGQIKKRANVENLSEDAGVSEPYFRGSEKRPPHNLFLKTSKVDGVVKKKGFPLKLSVGGFAFDRSGEASGPAITNVYIPFSPAANSRWIYDASAKRYMRQQNGSAHMDKGTGKQLSARNVVVMWVKMEGTGHRDSAGSETFDVKLLGSNRVSIFRDGKRFDGQWTAGKDAPPAFKAADGTPLRLSPGNTWFQVVPSNLNIQMQ